MKITNSQLGDGVLAAVLVVFGLFGTAYAEGETTDGRAYALVATAAAMLALRRRWPLQVLAAVSICTCAYLIIGYAYGPILITFMIAAYTAARHAPPVRSAPVCLAALLLLLVHLFIRDTALGMLGLIPVSTWVVVPFALGFTLRLRHEAALRARTEAIRQSVDDERLRVAQEVHDIVGHGLAAIKMQADIALHVLAKQPGQAEPALLAISRTSGEALDELRATLAPVRLTGADAPRTPVASLARLDDLLKRMADAGVHVRLRIVGQAPAALPIDVDLAGYRIVQESLTNVLRHSGARHASVDIRHETDGVLITIANPVTETAPTQGGLGTAGMRARVQALGGQFTAGHQPHGCFEVRAHLPTGDRT
ncbi:signal transduction histidine kinase [Hamadaea flava]|uniref:histidine kinase n=1 Tax=Hamadaea flava TaxID=1742688 RepID=A0ABV8LLI9_9ACTN|nr:histidine kinase [Hamadaea flava]MCP2329590.1 signal transduction histidine kinase [Hamadaea flava]